MITSYVVDCIFLHNPYLASHTLWQGKILMYHQDCIKVFQTFCRTDHGPNLSLVAVLAAALPLKNSYNMRRGTISFTV
jgi:hypothetical protein